MQSRKYVSYHVYKTADILNMKKFPKISVENKKKRKEEKKEGRKRMRERARESKQASKQL